MDLDPGQHDVSATFNSALDDGSCSFGCKWYYGLDASPPLSGCKFDLVSVALHELGHGLGFFSTVDRATGAKLNGFDDAFMRFLEDHTTGKLYPAMTDAERVAASKSGSNLQWVGPSVVAATGSKTAGIGPMGHAEMYAPATLSGSSVSHWNTNMTPQELLEPFYSIPLHDPGLAVEALVDQGWTLLTCGDGLVDAGEQCDDGNRASGDGCSASCTVEPCRTCSGQPSVCGPAVDGTSCSDGVSATVPTSAVRAAARCTPGRLARAPMATTTARNRATRQQVLAPPPTRMARPVTTATPALRATRASRASAPARPSRA